MIIKPCGGTPLAPLRQHACSEPRHRASACAATPEQPDMRQEAPIGNPGCGPKRTPVCSEERPTGTPLARAFLASLREVLGFAVHLVCFALAAISGLLHPQVCHLGGVGTWFVPLCRLSLQEGLMHSDLCVDHADHTDLRCCASHAQGISLRLSQGLPCVRRALRSPGPSLCHCQWYSLH